MKTHAFWVDPSGVFFVCKENNEHMAKFVQMATMVHVVRMVIFVTKEGKKERQLRRKQVTEKRKTMVLVSKTVHIGKMVKMVKKSQVGAEGEDGFKKRPGYQRWHKW